MCAVSALKATLSVPPLLSEVRSRLLRTAVLISDSACIMGSFLGGSRASCAGCLRNTLKAEELPIPKWFWGGMLLTIAVMLLKFASGHGVAEEVRK
jgi:hypothetical protein